MLKASHRNILVKHPSYQKILHLYTERLQTDGRVNNKRFFEEVIKPEIPGYNMQSWYLYIKKFGTPTGVLSAEVVDGPAREIIPDAEKKLNTVILDNKTATSKGIALALNIATERLQKIMENPQLMTAKEAIDLLFKAMKAQDSRIHAIGKVREDNREEEKLSRAFSDNAYGE